MDKQNDKSELCSHCNCIIPKGVTRIRYTRRIVACPKCSIAILKYDPRDYKWLEQEKKICYEKFNLNQLIDQINSFENYNDAFKFIFNLKTFIKVKILCYKHLFSILKEKNIRLSPENEKLLTGRTLLMYTMVPNLPDNILRKVATIVLNKRKLKFNDFDKTNILKFKHFAKKDIKKLKEFMHSYTKKVYPYIDFRLSSEEFERYFLCLRITGEKSFYNSGELNDYEYLKRKFVVN